MGIALGGVKYTLRHTLSVVLFLSNIIKNTKYYGFISEIACKFAIYEYFNKFFIYIRRVLIYNVDTTLKLNISISLEVVFLLR